MEDNCVNGNISVCIDRFWIAPNLCRGYFFENRAIEMYGMTRQSSSADIKIPLIDKIAFKCFFSFFFLPSFTNIKYVLPNKFYGTFVTLLSLEKNILCKKKLSRKHLQGKSLRRYNNTSIHRALNKSRMSRNYRLELFVTICCN